MLPRWRLTWEPAIGSGGRPHPLPGSFYAMVVVAALAEATADTLASELGEVVGGQPLLVTTFSARVAPGTNGAVSLAGTAAGNGRGGPGDIGSASTLGLGCEAVCAGLGAVGGLFIDSLLGATAERRGWLNNDAVNFLSTFAASAMAILIFIVRQRLCEISSGDEL